MFKPNVIHVSSTEYYYQKFINQQQLLWFHQINSVAISLSSSVIILLLIVHLKHVSGSFYWMKFYMYIRGRSRILRRVGIHRVFLVGAAMRHAQRTQFLCAYSAQRSNLLMFQLNASVVIRARCEQTLLFIAMHY